MTYINYFVNLTEEEKLEVDKQVRKNRFELIFAIFFLPFPMLPTPYVLFFLVESFDNKIVQERIIDNQKFCSLEDNNQQVILVKAGDNAPSVPTSWQPSDCPTPPAGGRPSRPIYMPKYRTPPQVVPGAGTNPAGAGSGGKAPEFDYQCSIPENKKSQESKSDSDYPSNAPRKKKQFAQQCELDENVNERKIEIVYRIKENPALIREAKIMGKDQAAQKDVNNLIEQLSLGMTILE